MRPSVRSNTIARLPSAKASTSSIAAVGSPEIQAMPSPTEIVITSYSIHYTKLYEDSAAGNLDAESVARLGDTAMQQDGTVRLGDQEYLVTSMALGTDQRNNFV